MSTHLHHSTIADKDTIFMQRALELAINGQGGASPNPMVGCIIEWNDKIIGEGWHMKYGGPHAEVNAINCVSDKSLLKDATAYVTLEPCSHHGITPPCSDLLIASQIKRVVICNVDPNPLVSGKGIKKLENAGIEVITGLLSESGLDVNKRFFTFHEKRRPYIILKWAETADGFIARENFDSKWISNPYSRQLVHLWRSQEDAVMVGKNTAQYDNPLLNVRDVDGKNPIRILIDHECQVPSSHYIFDQSIPTICYNYKTTRLKENLDFVAMSKENFEHNVLFDLYKKKILSIIIEGGSKLLQSFIDKGLWDEARVFKSENTFKNGISAPFLNDSVLENTENIVGDQLFIYKRKNG